MYSVPMQEDGEGAAFVSEAVGGALGIAPNGMNVLRELDESLFLAVAGQGYPVSHLHVRNAWGWNLASLPASDRGNPPLRTILVSRQGL